MCGPSKDQTHAYTNEKNISDQQTANFSTLSDQAKSIFGSSSQIFKDLTSAFEPILAAGPGQEGYTAAQKANLNSQAITQTGQQYRNAAAAAGERAAAAGGGNALLPSGVAAQQAANIAQAGAGQTAGQLADIRNQSAQLGRQNWLTAAGALSGAPGVFSPATSAGSILQGSGSSAMQGANQVFNDAQTMQSQQNWWLKPVAGALGGALSFIPGVGPILGSMVSGAAGGSGGGGGLLGSLSGGGGSSSGGTGSGGWADTL